MFDNEFTAIQSNDSLWSTSVAAILGASSVYHYTIILRGPPRLLPGPRAAQIKVKRFIWRPEARLHKDEHRLRNFNKNHANTFSSCYCTIPQTGTDTSDRPFNKGI